MLPATSGNEFLIRVDGSRTYSVSVSGSSLEPLGFKARCRDVTGAKHWTIRFEECNLLCLGLTKDYADKPYRSQSPPYEALYHHAGAYTKMPLDFSEVVLLLPTDGDAVFDGLAVSFFWSVLWYLRHSQPINRTSSSMRRVINRLTKGA